jgi:hypothetical protein
VYGFISRGRRGRLVFEQLPDALYTALLDLHEQRREPLEIRQGRQVPYWHKGLDGSTPASIRARSRGARGGD